MSDLYSGKWAGQYTLGDGYPKEMIGTTTNFDIIMDVSDGVIKGTCRDDENEVPLDAPATIEGFVRGSFINFVKRYTHAWAQDENNNFLEAPNEPSHEVIYTGYYKDEIFEGEWEIVSHTEVFPDGSMREYLLHGTWSMKKL